MFFIISKALQFIIYPVNWVIALGIYGHWSKNEKRKRRASHLSLLLFIAFTNPVIHDFAFRFWETPAVPFANLEHHDVAIVLGGYSDPKAFPRDRLHLKSNPNRLINAVQLYKYGKVNKLILTGGSATIIGEKRSESAIIARYLSDLGIPEQDVFVEESSRNTYENALYTQALLEEKGMQNASCVLVSSAFHLPRATRCFQAVGMEVTPFATDLIAPQKKKENPIRYLTPSSEVFFNWGKLIKEWVGMAAYKVRGYI